MGSAENITGNGFIGSSSFISRRQDAVEFTAEVTLKFAPNLSNPEVKEEEAGITLFIQRLQHFDLGVVVLSDTSGHGVLKKFIRLRVFSANSSADGMTDPLSQPRIFPLSDAVQNLRLRVQAVNASTYVFSYSDSTNSKQSNAWKIIGYGAASEVSGGFTGVSHSCLTCVPQLKTLYFTLDYSRHVCHRQWT